MRIAVVTEISTRAKNPAILEALENCGHTVLNVGMSAEGDEQELTYLQTGLLSALLIHLNLSDFIVAGCGTGQGYFNSVMQYPGMTCALVSEPLDAWLAQRINAPNSVSLALNKGFGWAGDINLRLIFNELFAQVEEKGYPSNRVESQTKSREKIKKISEAAHLSMVEILDRLEDDISAPIYKHKPFTDIVSEAPESDLKQYILARIKEV